MLKKIARWLKDNDEEGYVETLHSQSDPDDDNRFLTTVIWADTL